MNKQNPELEPFSKFIEALEPWLNEVVLVGGWAHRLYRLDPRARKLDYLPLTTLDSDVAVPAKLKKKESTLRNWLLGPALKRNSLDRIVRRRLIITTEKEEASTQSFSRRSKEANTTGAGSGRQRKKSAAFPPNCFATLKFC
jgi:hypothetical protein